MSASIYYVLPLLSIIVGEMAEHFALRGNAGGDVPQRVYNHRTVADREGDLPDLRRRVTTLDRGRKFGFDFEDFKRPNAPLESRKSACLTARCLPCAWSERKSVAARYGERLRRRGTLNLAASAEYADESLGNGDGERGCKRSTVRAEFSEAGWHAESVTSV